MQIIDALKNLAIAVSGSTEKMTEGQLADVIQNIADNWQGSGGGAAPSVDTLSGATDLGKELMKAADEAAARNAIGAGTPYTLPAAGDTTLGGVKRAAAVSFATDGATPETCAAAISGIINSLKASGAMQ